MASCFACAYYNYYRKVLEDKKDGGCSDVTLHCVGDVCRISKFGDCPSELIMRVGIAGYGNIGRSLERMLSDTDDIDLVGVFTRRDIKEVETLGATVYSASELADGSEDIDVLLLCYGSSSDLPTLAPHLAAKYSTVDTFDNHTSITDYKTAMDISSRRGGKVSLISMGWDPGFLSLMRLYANAFVPHAGVNTFWGRGVSRGHSEAIGRIEGVRRAIQYTVPREDALTLATLVSHPLSDTDRHRRVCYIVADEGREDYITSRILTMEHYFAGYETEIHFITDDEFSRYHTTAAHRGRLYALGSSGRYREVKHSLYLDLDIGSNPDFTASIMLAGARACAKIKEDGGVGAYTPFDIPPSYFLPENSKNVNKYL